MDQSLCAPWKVIMLPAKQEPFMSCSRLSFMAHDTSIQTDEMACVSNVPVIMTEFMKVPLPT